MPMRSYTTHLTTLLVAALLTIVSSASCQAAEARNVIFLIGDGWGFNHLTASTYYRHGDAGKTSFEKSFIPLACSTYSIKGHYDPAKAWETFEWVKEGATDSSAAATALATGNKTENGMLGVDPDKNPLTNLTHKAEGLGKSTGVITSVQLSHATPAGFVAHNESRGNYAEIANEMLTQSPLEVIMGGGHPWYDDSGKPVAEIPETGLPEGINEKNYQFVGGPDTWEQLLAGTVGADANGDGTADPWALVQDRDALEALAEGDTPNRVLFVAKAAQTLQCNRESIAPDPKEEITGQTPRIETVPALDKMARAALNVLDNNPNGFFLMIEGGAIDWASHANHSGRMIEEAIEFYDTIDAVVAWVEANSSWDETLVVITADHETGYITGPDSDPEWNPIENRGQGVMPGMAWNSSGHTNSLVPLFVKGAGSESFVTTANKEDPRRGPYLDNTDLPKLMEKAMKANKAAEEAKAE